MGGTGSKTTTSAQPQTTARKQTTVEKKGTERMSVASGSEKAIGGKLANTKGHAI